MDSDSHDEVREVIPIGNSESSKDVDLGEDMDSSDEDDEDYVAPIHPIVSAEGYRNGGALNEDEGNGRYYGEAREVIPIANSESSEDSDHDEDLDPSDEYDEDYIPPIHSTVSNEAYGNGDALDGDEGNREIMVYMYGQDRIHFSFSGQRFNLDGDGREFLVTGSNNVLSLYGENSRLVVSGENNVIYYNVEGNNEIIAEGSGVRVIAVEENEHGFDHVLTFQSLVHGHGARNRIHVRSRGRITPTAPPVSSSSAPNLSTPSSNGPDSSVPPDNASSSSVVEPQVSNPSVAPDSRPQTDPPSSEPSTQPGFIERLRHAMRWPRQRRSQESNSIANNIPLSLQADSASEILEIDARKAESVPETVTSSNSTEAVSAEPSTSKSTNARDAKPATSKPTSAMGAAGAPETMSSLKHARKIREKYLKTKRPSLPSEAGPSKKVKKESTTRDLKKNSEIPEATSNGNMRYAPNSFNAVNYSNYFADYDEDEEDTQPLQPRETLSTRRFLVEQQNRAYEATLRADKEKAEKKLKEEQERQRKEQEIKEKEELLRRLKEDARNSVPEEPALESAPNNGGGGDCNNSNTYRVITLQLRLPNGNIVKRRFRSTDTLQNLIQFTFSIPDTPLSFGILRRPNEELTLNYPEYNPTLEELRLSNSEVFIVRSYEEEQRNADLQAKSCVKATGTDSA